MWNTALVQGLRHGQRFGLLLPLYLCGLLLGLVQTWPLGLAAINGSLRNTFVDRLVTGGIDTLGDLFIANPEAAQPASLWVVLTLPLLMLFSLAYNFFSGGMLSASAGTHPFWAGCRRTFWSFSVLGLILVLLALVVSVGVGLLGGLLGLGSVAITVVTLVLLQLLNLLGEYARAIAVARDRLNPFVIFGAAVAFCVRHLGGVLAMGLLGILLHIAIAALYLLGSNAMGGSIWTIALQQICVIVWLWVKFVRLLWALFYVQTSDQRVRSLFPEAPYAPMEGVSTIH